MSAPPTKMIGILSPASCTMRDGIEVGFITTLADGASDYCYLKMADAIKKSQIAYRRTGLQAVDALKNADSYSAFVVLLDQLSKGAFRPMNAMAVS